jgi:hypothetical protein
MLRDYRREVAERRADMQSDARFMLLYERCAPFTMTSMERMYALYQSVCHIVSARTPGSMVECGVWRGGSMMLVAHTLIELGETTRDLLLYDTFRGLPAPSVLDTDYAGVPADAEWRANQRAGHNEWCYASLDEVRRNMASTGYDPTRVRYVEGMVEDTIPKVVPEQVAVLRLDTDFYESTRHEMAHLYPRLVPAGVLVIDDYGHWQGQRRAIDEYFAASCERVLLHRVDYACRIGQKGVPG